MTSQTLDFLNYLQNRGFAKRTINWNTTEAEKYQSWLQLNHHQTPEAATKKQLLDYLQHCKESRNLNNDSQYCILKVLKNYYKYLAANYDVPNITAFIKIRGINRKKLQALFTPDELDLLCDAYYYYIEEYVPHNNALHYFPNYTKLLQGRYILLTLVAYQGLKMQEIKQLTKSNFNLKKAILTIHSSKLSAARTLPLEASQIGVLMQYYANETTENNEPIVPNGNHTQKLATTLRELTEKPSMGITTFKSFKQIRASKITHWIKQYGLRKAQYLAGHKHITSTERFLDNNIETLQNDFNNFHPLN